MTATNTVKDGSGTWRVLLVDSDGYLKVIPQAGAGAGGVMVDDAAFTPGTSEVVVIGGFADEGSPDSVDEGDTGAVRMSLDRMLLVQVSGRAAEDAAVAGNPALVGGRYDASARTLDSGDAGAVAIDTAGRPIVASPETEDGAVVGNPLLIGGRYDASNRDLDDGDSGAIALDADARVYVNTGWTPGLQADEAADDSDKTFTVPSSTEWEIMSIWIELITTATGGDRVMTVELQDGSSDVILRIDAGAIQADSITRYYIFAPWNADLAAFRGVSSDLLMTPFPPGLILPATYKVRIYDSAAVDAAADDMVLQMLVKARMV